MIGNDFVVGQHGLEDRASNERTRLAQAPRELRGQPNSCCQGSPRNIYQAPLLFMKDELPKEGKDIYRRTCENLDVGLRGRETYPRWEA